MAGINAALRVKDREPLILERSEAYIGVMIDDLVTLGTREPYRMFTSRAEYRLLLREDNADLRLREKGHAIGLVQEEVYGRFLLKQEMIARELERIRTTRISPERLRKAASGTSILPDAQNGTTLEQLLKRPDITYAELEKWDDASRDMSICVREQVEIQVKYRGYIERQLEQVEQARRVEHARLPVDIDYALIHGLTSEVREKLARNRPDTLGQALRIPGVTPAAVSVLAIALRSRTWEKLKQ
jgi:tRNA uridine 5-carboxymethylaminomethyl modification enzyme